MDGTIATKLLILASTVLYASALDPHRLNCDFTSQCCWSGNQWIVRNDPVNINEFRRTFLVGRSKPPPDGPYLMYAGKQSGVIYRSCPLCSQDGKITVQFRHWQSPTSRLRICWQVADTNVINDCVQTFASTQSTVLREQFNVTKGLDIELFFMADNTDSSNVAVAMLDRIRVDYMDCETTINIRPVIDEIAVAPSPVAFERAVEQTQGISSPIAPVIAKSRKSKNKKGKNVQTSNMSTANPALAHRTHKIDTTQVEVVERTAAVPQEVSPLRAVKLPPPVPPPMRPILPIPRPVPVAPAISEVKEIEKPRPAVVSGSPNLPIASIAAAAKPGKDPKDANPLHDLLGEDFANFLDPDYVTDENKEDGGELKEKAQRVKPKLTIKSSENRNSGEKIQNQIPEPVASTASLFPTKPIAVKPSAPFHQLHRQIPLGPVQGCETPGGCLFNNGFCSWTSPPQIIQNNRFRMVQVGQSQFIQATVAAGNVSAIETGTNMNEAHTVLFDFLKWPTTTRLVACCSVAGQLECPYASTQIASQLIWQISNFECPQKTDRIVFICENYGTAEEGNCAIDNIRIHRAYDIFYVEPCQKNSLNSL